jgi:CheY-like chemotaxis protein
VRILLVEDHRDSADMLALVLRGSGHDVLAVGTGTVTREVPTQRGDDPKLALGLGAVGAAGTH